MSVLRNAKLLFQLPPDMVHTDQEPLRIRSIMEKEANRMSCEINVTGGELPQEEINAYIARAKEKYGREPQGIDIRVDGDFVELSYDFGHTPFQRIRRITGYLVGTLDRFNNGKRAEERDRVKHAVTE